MYFGVTKDPFVKYSANYVGLKPTDWSMEVITGSKYHADQSTPGYSPFNAQRPTEIECVVDRIAGTISFIVNGVDRGVAFEDSELSTGDMHFVISMQWIGDSFLIEK